MELIRVLVADDHSLVRAGFRSILGDEDDIDVVGEAKNGTEAVEVAISQRPDLVLMDIRMPGMDGLEATRRITADPRLRGTKVVVLTTFDLDEYVFGALKAGASAFLLKGVEPQALIDAVRTVAGGDALLEPSATRRLIEAYVKGWRRHPARHRRAHRCLPRSPPARKRYSGSSPLAGPTTRSPATCSSAR
jgi:DNA-binding NarL/FixJ family response regulator